MLTHSAHSAAEEAVAVGPKEEEEGDDICRWVGSKYLDLSKEQFLAQVKPGPIKVLLTTTIEAWPDKYFATQLALHPCTNDLCGLLAIASAQKQSPEITLETVLDTVDKLVEFGSEKGRNTFRFNNSREPWNAASEVGKKLAKFFLCADFKSKFGILVLEDIKKTAANISSNFKIWHKVGEWFER